jgi:hypothetical protein
VEEFLKRPVPDQVAPEPAIGGMVYMFIKMSIYLVRDRGDRPKRINGQVVRQPALIPATGQESNGGKKNQKATFHGLVFIPRLKAEIIMKEKNQKSVEFSLILTIKLICHNLKTDTLVAKPAGIAKELILINF